MSSALQASESPVSASNGEGNGLVAERPSSNSSAPQRESEKASRNESPPPPLKNRRIESSSWWATLCNDPYYKARKSGKRIADFALATHEKTGQTKYWRNRAFDKLAERVRDTVRKSEKEVEAVVYGPKQMQQKKKIPEGWTQETVTGYYASMVHVPKKGG
jgi:Single-strand binding protein family